MKQKVRRLKLTAQFSRNFLNNKFVSAKWMDIKTNEKWKIIWKVLYSSVNTFALVFVGNALYFGADVVHVYKYYLRNKCSSWIYRPQLMILLRQCRFISKKEVRSIPKQRARGADRHWREPSPPHSPLCTWPHSSRGIMCQGFAAGRGWGWRALRGFKLAFCWRLPQLLHSQEETTVYESQ
jgi:hypothetical protein